MPWTQSWLHQPQVQPSSQKIKRALAAHLQRRTAALEKTGQLSIREAGIPVKGWRSRSWIQNEEIVANEGVIIG